MRTICAVFILLIVGCTQNQWAKEGGTEEQFITDRYTCQQMVQARYGPLGLQLLDKNGDIAQCLKDHGYRDLAITQMANDPRAHLTPGEIARIKSQINPK